MAYSNSDIRGEGSGCVMWFGDLIDMKQLQTGKQDLYIRMAASELDSFNAKDMWEIFQSYWEIQEVFIPVKRDKCGNHFGFARFVDVHDVCILCFMEKRLMVNLPWFARAQKA
ncbi:hypothetical protein JHK86_016581 [Glycine max]|nr:hypothetical protein JHK86_016581 [Glycine max]